MIYFRKLERNYYDKSKRDKIKYELKPESMSSNYVCRKCKSKEHHIMKFKQDLQMNP